MTLTCCPWVWWQPQCSEPRRWKVLAKTAAARGPWCLQGACSGCRALGVRAASAEACRCPEASGEAAKVLAQACMPGTARGLTRGGLRLAPARCAGALPGAARSPGLGELPSPWAWGTHVPTRTS